MTQLCSVQLVMSFKESNVSSNGSGVTEYEKDKTKLLYCTMKDNFQQIASQMKKYSGILQDLSKDMDDINKSMVALQEHSLATKSEALTGETVTEQKKTATVFTILQ